MSRADERVLARCAPKVAAQLGVEAGGGVGQRQRQKDQSHPRSSSVIGRLKYYPDRCIERGAGMRVAANLPRL